MDYILNYTPSNFHINIKNQTIDVSSGSKNYISVNEARLVEVKLDGTTSTSYYSLPVSGYDVIQIWSTVYKKYVDGYLVHYSVPSDIAKGRYYLYVKNNSSGSSEVGNGYQMLGYVYVGYTFNVTNIENISNDEFIQYKIYIDGYEYLKEDNYLKQNANNAFILKDGNNNVIANEKYSYSLESDGILLTLKGTTSFGRFYINITFNNIQSPSYKAVKTDPISIIGSFKISLKVGNLLRFSDINFEDTDYIKEFQILIQSGKYKEAHDYIKSKNISIIEAQIINDFEKRLYNVQKYNEENKEQITAYGGDEPQDITKTMIWVH